MSKAYYNENDPRAAEWLRNLIFVNAIADGDVDDRSIENVTPNDLKGYAQHHFFAGIGGWSYALRLAGWPDDRAVWTGSCPCQPFSQAGAGRGTDDPRHLWPAWRWLVDQCRPTTIFGEQVASPAGRNWLAGVRTDLEALGYGVGAADLCAAGVGAPHIRQRLFWVAIPDSRECNRFADGEERHNNRQAPGWQQSDREPEPCSQGSRMGQPDRTRRKSRRQTSKAARHRNPVESAGGDGRLCDSDGPGSQGRRVLPERADERAPWAATLGNWLPCADEKARRIEPGLEPLVDGLPGRVGLLRGYGNAIVPQVAAKFIEAYVDTLNSVR